MADQIPQTTLGRTGLVVTRLGTGGAYCETADGYRARARLWCQLYGYSTSVSGWR